jgi:S1-C subfamily serine protease
MISGKWLMAVMLAAALCLSGRPAAGAEESGVVAAGRTAQQKYSNAVINVTATMKISVQGEAGGSARSGDQERKNELLATVIDSSGLTICSLAALDPTSAIGNVRVNVGGQPQTVKLKADLHEVKYRLADGTELPARVVLKDEDLDLAFLATEKPMEDADKAKIAVVSLADAAKEAQVLDAVIFLGRYGKGLSYEPSVAAGRITGKLTRPRTEYIAGGSPGTPVFSGDGKLLGIILTHRRLNNDVTAGPGGIQADMTAVVIPAGDIVEAANQAKEEAKKPVKKTEPTTAPAGGGQ